MSSYSARLKKHLADYKRGRLGISTDGTWVQNKRPYPHILPVEMLEQNILESVRADFWRYADTKGLRARLHRDFHHLGSSQALAFNVFFPFFQNDAQFSHILLKAIGLPLKKISNWEFESVPDKKEGTNFDFCATFEDASRLLVEVKLSETEFGDCEDDTEHQDKLRSTYRARLQTKVVSKALTSPTFFEAYQLLRNVSHIREGDTLVLLVPRANAGTWKQAEAFIRDILTDEMRRVVQLVALEDVLNRIRNSAADTPLSGYADLLSEKYILARTAR